MLARLLFFLALIFSVKAINLEEILANYTDLQKCLPTFKMFDASGKFPTGIISGNVMDLGNFDQCIGIEETNNKSEVIKGQYCLMRLNIIIQKDLDRSRFLSQVFGNDFWEFSEMKEEISKVKERADEIYLSLILGWCFPHTCPIDEFSIFLSSVLGIQISPIMDDICQTKDKLKNEYNVETIIFITFLALTLFLMVISTLYDMYIQHLKKKPAHIILIAFSVKTNGQKLLSVSNNPDQLPCLNGIRFISMMWVILGHRYLQTASEPILNGISFLTEWTNDAANMYLLNAPLAVDTFFVLSGILLGYGYCLAKSKQVKFNIFLFYLHRYLRLAPVLAVIIWATSTKILSFLGSGPLWPFTAKSLGKPCITNWWPSLLFIQNYYYDAEMCLGHTWYLSVDMQLFILSPIILIPLWKWPKRTLIASAVLVVGSMASSFAVTFVYNLITAVNDLGGDLQKYMKKYYYTTHTRYGPWLMGLMLGYYLFKLKKTKANRISLHPAQVAFGWIVGMGLLLSTLYGGHDLMINPYKLGNSFFNGFHRHGWALGICWVIYACTQGYGGPVNAFLSWSPFQILGRFTYTIYLVHIILQTFMAATNRTNKYFSDFNMMYVFWGDLMVSLAISICLTLAFESPMVTIEKVLFKTGHKPKKPELPVHHNSDISKAAHINK